MRVIAGLYKGQKLIDSSSIKTLKPTTDKNREALFNLINHAKFLQEIDFNLQNSSIVDVCCGTGAVGIEALSRGAKFAIFIDNNSQHLEITIKNIEKLKIQQELVVLNNNAEFLTKNKFNYLYCSKNNDLIKEYINNNFTENSIKDKNLDNHWRLVFCDPPYQNDYKKIFSNLIENNFIDHKTLLIIEFPNEKIADFNDFYDTKLKVLATKTYGKSGFGFYVLKA
jgi:16S rRNA (guanine(966)-N(2))-methyltransferase RsmD